MENLQKKPLFVLEDGVVESEVKLLPRLKEVLQELMDKRGADLRKCPLFRIKNDGCWDRIGRLSTGGYAVITVNGHLFRSHRFLFEKIIGPIPDGLFIDHLCRNRACSNPLHLEPVTSRENTLRGIGITSINAKKTHCKNGHLLSGKNLNEKKAKMGGRACRICNTISKREWRRKSGRD
jgi:hypothetical protein